MIMGCGAAGARGFWWREERRRRKRRPFPEPPPPAATSRPPAWLEAARLSAEVSGLRKDFASLRREQAVARGDRLLKGGDGAGAVAEYDAVFVIPGASPAEEASVLAKRAHAFLKEKRWAEAEADGARAINLGLREPRVTFRRDLALEGLGHLEEALESVACSLEKLPPSSHTAAAASGLEARLLRLISNQKGRKAEENEEMRRALEAAARDAKEEKKKLATPDRAAFDEQAEKRVEEIKTKREAEEKKRAEEEAKKKEEKIVEQEEKARDIQVKLDEAVAKYADLERKLAAAVR